MRPHIYIHLPDRGKAAVISAKPELVQHQNLFPATELESWCFRKTLHTRLAVCVYDRR